MKEIASFLAAIEANPSDAITRAVLADYLEDHPHLVANGEREQWSRLLRFWSASYVLINNVTVTLGEISEALLHSLCIGSQGQIFGCRFMNVDTYYRKAPNGFRLENCQIYLR